MKFPEITDKKVKFNIVLTFNGACVTQVKTLKYEKTKQISLTHLCTGEINSYYVKSVIL